MSAYLIARLIALCVCVTRQVFLLNNLTVQRLSYAQYIVWPYFFLLYFCAKLGVARINDVPIKLGQMLST